MREGGYLEILNSGAGEIDRLPLYGLAHTLAISYCRSALPALPTLTTLPHEVRLLWVIVGRHLVAPVM